jgi:hypothetical protein
MHVLNALLGSLERTSTKTVQTAQGRLSRKQEETVSQSPMFPPLPINLPVPTSFDKSHLQLLPPFLSCYLDGHRSPTIPQSKVNAQQTSKCQVLLCPLLVPTRDSMPLACSVHYLLDKQGKMPLASSVHDQDYCPLRHTMSQRDEAIPR